MRHQRIRNRLNQKPAHARMLTRNLITSMLLYETLRTTKKRAMVIAPEIDRLITYAKSHEPHVAIRYLNAVVTDKNACRKVMEVFIKRYSKRNSGLTRVTPAGARIGDGASLVDLAFVDGVNTVPETTEVPSKKTSPAKKK